jgi:hypothetical protein
MYWRRDDQLEASALISLPTMAPVKTRTAYCNMSSVMVALHRVAAVRLRAGKVRLARAQNHGDGVV